LLLDVLNKEFAIENYYPQLLDEHGEVAELFSIKFVWLFQGGYPLIY